MHLLIHQRVFTSDTKFGSGTVRLVFSMPIKEISSMSDIATITADLEVDSKTEGYNDRFTNRHHTEVRRPCGPELCFM
jgi:hypothetical protein